MASAIDMFRTIRELGENFGFHVQEEVSSAFLPGHLDDYSPRVDLTWSIPIDEPKSRGLSMIIPEFHDKAIDYFPLVGFEVEATDPTTKTQISNIANLQTLGLPYGFLVIDNTKADGDLYRRANRVLTTYNFMNGHSNFGVIDYSQILNMVETIPKTTALKYTEPNKEVKYGKGGEKQETLDIREKIVKLGSNYGFNIQQDWMPKDLQNMHQLMNSVYITSGSPEDDLSRRFLGKITSWTPTQNNVNNRWDYYFTKSAIDVTWNIQLPPNFIWFIESLKAKNEPMKVTNPILRDPSSLWPILGFEIEGSMGKHGGGGIFNLSRYCYIGLEVVPESQYRRAQSKIKVYSRTSGIQNVFVTTYEKILEMKNHDNQ